MLRLTGGNIPQAVNDLLCFCFVLFIFLCTWYKQQQGHRNAATFECKRMLLTSRGSWGKVEAGGLWVGTLWDWLSISSCRHYQLAKIGNLFKLLFSHMCTLQKLGFLFIIYISIQGQLWALTHRLRESETQTSCKGIFQMEMKTLEIVRRKEILYCDNTILCQHMEEAQKKRTSSKRKQILKEENPSDRSRDCAETEVTGSPFS